MPSAPSAASSANSRLRQAFVLGAGLGTRLKRLTEIRPKPLIPLANRPLITAAFDHLASEAGVSEIIINTHHLANEYKRIFPSKGAQAAYQPTDQPYQEKRSPSPIQLTFRHEPELLETGGGLKNIEELLHEDDLIVYNGDVFTTLPLQPAINAHLTSGREVTLILRSHGGPFHIAVENQASDGKRTEPTKLTEHATGRVTDIRALHRGEPGTHLFTGIYILKRRFLRRLPSGKASIIPTFLAMLKEGAEIGAITINDGLWLDLGTREQYLAAHRALAESGEKAPWVHPSANVAPDARITGASAIGPGSRVHSGATLHDTILWENTEVAAGSRLNRCIITDRQHIAGSHVDLDL